MRELFCLCKNAPSYRSLPFGACFSAPPTAPSAPPGGRNSETVWDLLFDERRFLITLFQWRASSLRDCLFLPVSLLSSWTKKNISPCNPTVLLQTSQANADEIPARGTLLLVEQGNSKPTFITAKSFPSDWLTLLLMSLS